MKKSTVKAAADKSGGLRDKLKKQYQEVVRYLIVGVLTTVVSLGTYFICTWTFLNPEKPLELQAANLISWVAAVAFAYVTNRIFVFGSKNKHVFQEIGRFVAARVGSLVMDMVIMFVGVTLLGANDTIVKLIVQVVVTVANYVLSKWIVFKDER